MRKDNKKIIVDDMLPGEQYRDELKKLYNWSYEDAVKAQNIYELENPEKIDVNDPGFSMSRQPFSLWINAQEMIELYKTYKAGDKGAILKTLHHCFYHQLPLPKWCEKAYLDAYRSIKFYYAKSWDDVFGKPHKKGTHLATKKQENEKGFLVYDRIKQIKKIDPSIPIDGFLFERIGREFAIGSKTLTEEYYYKQKNFFEKK